jgi:tetratricopeptide (TPR) repeat protein
VNWRRRLEIGGALPEGRPVPAPVTSKPNADPRRQTSRRAEKAARFARRMIGLAVLIILVALGTLAWNSRGKAVYQRWHRDQQLNAADVALRAKNYEEAARLAREVGAVDLRSLRAARIAAESLQQLGLADSVRWWRRLADLSRYDADSVTQWAGAALQFDDLRSAYAALRQFPRGTDTAAYHDIAGRVALNRDDRDKARFHLKQALEKQPENPEFQARFAEAHLDSPDPTERQRSVELLERLAAGAQSPRALSTLTQEALGRGDTERASRFSAQLLALTNLTFADRLVHLSVLHQGKSAAFTAELERIRSEATGDPSRLVRWLGWMSAEGLGADALRWFQGLPADGQNQSVVMSAAAELHVALGDWKGLREWVYNANWAELETQRLAYEALAFSRMALGGPGASEGSWRKALREANGQPQHLHWLAGRAERWELLTAAESTLWLMVQKDVDADGSLDRLAAVYRRLGQADGLLKVAKRQLELHPRDPAFEADVLYFSALLQIETAQLRPLAERVQARSVESPGAAVAVAMFKARANEAEGGLRILQALPANELTQPARRALLILLLAQDSDRAAARAGLETADPTGLLPEEAQMLVEARALSRLDKRAR